MSPGRTLAGVSDIKGQGVASTPNMQAPVRTLTLNLSEMGNHGKVWSREVACSDLGFQRITLVDASNRLEGGKAETATSYYNGVATGITADCIHPY